MKQYVIIWILSRIFPVYSTCPQAMNILDLQYIDDLSAAIADIEADDNIKSVMIWGGPKIFAVGGDIKYLLAADQPEMEVFIIANLSNN